MSASDATHNLSLTILRWIGVLPAAILGSVLVAFPVHWVVMSTFRWGDDNFIELSEEGAENVERVVFAFAVTLTFVLCGAYTAPKWKMPVAIALASLLTLLTAASYIYVALDPDLYFATPVRGKIGLIAGFGGLVTSFVVVRSWGSQVKRPN